jgi:hypothetical protein
MTIYVETFIRGSIDELWRLIAGYQWALDDGSISWPAER